MVGVSVRIGVELGGRFRSRDGVRAPIVVGVEVRLGVLVRIGVGVR